MKNADYKKEFLDTLPTEKQVLLERIFRMADPLEDKLNKDCSLFTMEEIDSLFGSQRRQNPAGLAKKCDLLMKYTIWMQTEHPIKYATYGSYAKKYNLYTPRCTIELINTNRIYNPSEFMEAIDKMDCMYDQMLFLAVYEGILTSVRQLDFFFLNSNCLDIRKNVIRIEDGSWLSISPRLMSLLNKGSKDCTLEGVGVHDYNLAEILARDRTLCYKRLNLNPRASETENKLKAKNHIQNQRKAVEGVVGDPRKFTITNIQMSGMLNALIQIGVVENFNDLKTYENNPQAGEIASRYGLTYKGVQSSNFIRRFVPYFVEPQPDDADAN